MRQQLITDDSLSDAQAMRLVRDFGTTSRKPARRLDQAEPTRQRLIARTVEDQVIPRLLKTCLGAQPAKTAISPNTAMVGEVAAFTNILLTGSKPEASDFVARLRCSGVACEQLLLNLLTPAARSLGDKWAEDACDFTDVTIGMLRLGSVMRMLARAFEPEVLPVQDAPRALLVQAPGEQHGFGVAMLASFFRHAGWAVVSEPVTDRAELVSHVRQGGFDMIGISLACADRLENLAADIRAIRAASRNPGLAVMVGGYAFLDHPQLAVMVGADATASDARLAVRRANALVLQSARAA